MHRKALSPIYIGRFVFTLNCKFRDEALIAVRALDSIVGLILREQAEKLFFFQWFLTVLALLLELDVDAAFEDLAHFNGAVLRLNTAAVTGI